MGKADIRHELARMTAQRIYGNMPKNLLVSHSKRIERIATKEEVFDFEYARLNTDWHIRYIVFDVDNPALNDFVSPSTFDVVDRGSGKYHSFYELLDPLPARKSQSRKTIELIKDVVRNYKQALNADKVILNQRLLSKNPLNNHWLVFVTGRQVTLSEMAQNMPKIDRMPEFYLNPESRNCTLFDTGRFFAYKIVNDCDSETDLYNKVLNMLDQQNNTEILNKFREKGKLSNSELRSIARSISRWTFERRLAICTKNRGIMNLRELGPESPLPTKQTAGAYYSHEIRKSNTKKRIDEALAELWNEGIKNPTQRMIAERAEITQQAVSNYRRGNLP